MCAFLTVSCGHWDACAAETPPAASDNILKTSPAGTNTLTLEAALALAREQNPEMRAAGASVDAASGRADQASRWTNPELELSAEDWPTARGFSQSKQLAGVGQTVPFPGKKRLDRQIGAQEVHAAQAQRGFRQVELEREVKTAFYQVLAAERLAGVAGELVQVAQASADAAQKRVEAGAAAVQEQLRAEILLEQARNEQTGFEREAAAARETLALVLGRPGLKNASLAGTLAETPNPSLLEERPESWLTNHPSVAAAQAEVDRARLAERRARLEPYPDPRLGVAGGRDGGSDASIVQFSVALPLPIFDRSKGRVKEARAGVRMAEAGRDAAQQRLLRDWGTAQKRLQAAARQVAQYRERILPKAVEAQRLVQNGFEQGKFGFIDALDTHRTAAEARLAYQQKLLEMNVAQADLEALAAGAVPVKGVQP